MPAKLVFHIGSFKSGSTAIQSTLATKSYSSNIKIFYPGLGPKERAEKRRGQHGPLADTLRPNHPAASQRNTRFSRVAAHIDAAQANVNVISGEKFEFVNPKALEQAVLEFLPAYRETLQIIFYVRPHAERLLSEYAERTKHGQFNGNLDELHTHTQNLTKPHQRSFYYHPRLMKWRKVFGNQLIVRPMIRSELFRANVVADFFNIILEGAAFDLTTPPRNNRSPSLEDLAAIKAFHQSTAAPKMQGRERERVGNILIQSFADIDYTDSTRLALHKSLVEDIVHSYRADAEALDRDFFLGKPLMESALKHALDTAIETPQPSDPALILEATQLRQIAAWGETLATLLSDRRVAGPQTHKNSSA